MKKLKWVALEIIQLIVQCICWVCHYSGLKFIWRKFKPEKDSEKLPTGFIWLVGIYLTSFGVSSQMYENRVDLIENRANSIFTQLSTKANKNAINRISATQNLWCPPKPNFWNYKTVFYFLVPMPREETSLYYDFYEMQTKIWGYSVPTKHSKYIEIVDLLKETSRVIKKTLVVQILT